MRPSVEQFTGCERHPDGAETSTHSFRAGEDVGGETRKAWKALPSEFKSHGPHFLVNSLRRTGAPPLPRFRCQLFPESCMCSTACRAANSSQEAFDLLRPDPSEAALPTAAITLGNGFLKQGLDVKITPLTRVGATVTAISQPKQHKTELCLLHGKALQIFQLQRKQRLPRFPCSRPRSFSRNDPAAMNLVIVTERKQREGQT